MDDMTPERIWVCLPEIFDALGFWYDKPQAGAVEYAPADRIAALEAENARMRNAIDDVVCGRGMFGLSASDDLKWAMRHLGAALTPAAPPDTTPPPKMPELLSGLPTACANPEPSRLWTAGQPNRRAWPGLAT